MISAFSGLALIGVIVLVGWVIGRRGVLPAGADVALGRVAYAVLAPCLLFTGVAGAELGPLFSLPLVASTAAALVCFAVFALIARGRGAGTRIVGALAAGYTNANYVGIPVATHVLGDAALVVPILIVQLLVITPVALTLLEFATTRHASLRSTLTGTARNPLILSVALGAVAALTGVRLPAVVADPIAAMGQAAVPVVLIAFGMSLAVHRPLDPGPDRVAAIAAAALKTTLMPAAAFLLSVALGLTRSQTYAVTVLAALPTAQNVFLYGQRFDAGVILARDAVFLSTIACVPALLVITTLFAVL